MALEKIQVVDQIEIDGEYAVRVRQSTKVMDDGVQIGGESYHRHVVMPDSDWSNEDAKVKKICDALFDADCKEAYQLQQYGHPSGDPSDSWTKEYLQKYCDRFNIDYTESNTKSELLTKISEASDEE